MQTSCGGLFPQRIILTILNHLLCCCSVTKSFPTLWPCGLQHAKLCWSSLFPEFTPSHVLWVGAAISHLVLCCPLFLLPSIFPAPVLLPGKSHGRRNLVGWSSWGCWESDTTEQLHFHFSLSCFGEGNGNPLQCSRLENPRDGGASWAAVYGLYRVRHNWSDLAAAAAAAAALIYHFRKKKRNQTINSQTMKKFKIIWI